MSRVECKTVKHSNKIKTPHAQINENDINTNIYYEHLAKDYKKK